ncbi:MAG: YafY family protein [Bacillota bacterium]|nr:YafY family protein [Bacillota bacterium]
MKLDRLLGILTILLQNERITSPILAERFEVSPRTIRRDIDSLCQAGIPIVTHQGGKGGISIAEGYKLDKSLLTEEELSNMIAALKGLGTVSEKTHIEQMLNKLSPDKNSVASLRESIVINLASHYKGSLTAKIQEIKEAIRESRLLEFEYYSEKGQEHRSMEPYFIAFQWEAWYAFGLCRLRHDWRLFKLTRMWELKLSDETFTPREIPPERRDLNELLTDHLKLVALFEKSVKYQLVETYGPGSFTETGGKLLLEIGYTNREFILKWLLGFGDKVKVLQPEDLVEEVLRTAKNIVASYE